LHGNEEEHEATGQAETHFIVGKATTIRGTRPVKKERKDEEGTTLIDTLLRCDCLGGDRRDQDVVWCGAGLSSMWSVKKKMNKGKVNLPLKGMATTDTPTPFHSKPHQGWSSNLLIEVLSKE